MHSGCADPCEFLKCGNLDCIISGSGGLRSRSPLILMLKIMEECVKFGVLLSFVLRRRFFTYQMNDWGLFISQLKASEIHFCLLITRMCVICYCSTGDYACHVLIMSRKRPTCEWIILCPQDVMWIEVFYLLDY